LATQLDGEATMNQVMAKSSRAVKIVRGWSSDDEAIMVIRQRRSHQSVLLLVPLPTQLL
ncbi:Hypothetical predicted protein, partial [Olea europaea subsp. europaea]